jgi:hypothetical protein
MFWRGGFFGITFDVVLSFIKNMVGSDGPCSVRGTYDGDSIIAQGHEKRNGYCVCNVPPIGFVYTWMGFKVLQQHLSPKGE